MKSKSAAPANPVLFFTDLLFAVCAVIFLTGFIPFAPGKIYAVFDQKPWLHRVIVAAAAAVGMAIAFFQRKHFKLSSIKKAVPTKFWPWIVFLFSGSLWTYASWMRHGNFKSGFDMAIFTQAIWNTAHGSFLYSSIKGGICLLGDHFSPFLILFALPYAICPEPELLLLIQAFLAASAVFPLYRLAETRMGNKTWALAVILAFCLYLPLRNSVRFEFHPEIAAIPFLIWAYVFLIQSKTAAASIMLVLALSTKESLAPVAFMFGIYAFITTRHKLFALFWTLFSPLYLYLVTRMWVPAITGEDYFYLSGNFMAWKDLGAGAFLKHLFSKDSLAYLIKIYLPTGGLAFLDPSFMLNLPALAQNLASRNETTRSIFFQYTATLTPFVFISTVEALRRFYPKRRFLILLLVSGVMMAGVSDFYIARRFAADKIGDTYEIKQLLFYNILGTDSVRTHEFLAPHLANRKELHIYENNHPKEGGSEKARNADCVVLHRRLLGDGEETAVASLMNKYDLKFEKDGLMVFKKK